MRTPVYDRVIRTPLLRLAPILVLAACATNPVTVSVLDDDAGWRVRERSTLVGDAPSAPSAAVLESRGLTVTADEARDPRVLLAAIEAAGLPEPERSLAATECLLRIERTLSRDEAARCALDAALRSWTALAHPWPIEAEFDERFALLRRFYNAAVARFIELTEGLVPGAVVESLGASFELRDGRDASCWPLDYFDELLPAHRLDISGIRARHVRSGIGAALAGVRDNRGLVRPQLPYLPPEGIVYPVTAVLRPAGEGVVELSLHDRFAVDTIAFGSRRAPLEADFTAPFAFLAAATHFHVSRHVAFFAPDAVGNCRGVYLLQPYDPERIPVLLIHGLWSSPLTWRELSNEIWGDPEVAARYQVWHFLYATGTPILNNARELRTELAAVRRHLDPELDDRATQDIVLVGHSLGGVLAKTVVQSSRDDIWNVRFAKSLGELSLDDRDRAHAEATYYFEPLPFVHRVIFIATPHRGSEIADTFIGRLGSGLIAVPERVSGFAERLLERNPGAMRPGTFTAPSSVDVLSPQHPVLRTLAELPVAERVTYHSILGDLEGGSAGTDGVVPFASAHLAGAASETVIRGDHRVNEHPAAIHEVLRILREHAASQP